MSVPLKATKQPKVLNPNGGLMKSKVLGTTKKQLENIQKENREYESELDNLGKLFYQKEKQIEEQISNIRDNIKNAPNDPKEELYKNLSKLVSEKDSLKTDFNKEISTLKKKYHQTEPDEIKPNQIDISCYRSIIPENDDKNDYEYIQDIYNPPDYYQNDDGTLEEL